MPNYLLSFPRSGNHLCRFFIELLSELPSFGCKSNSDDFEIYKNKFSEEVPFNIDMNYHESSCYRKTHHVNEISGTVNKLIFIIRDPREVLLRHYNYDINQITNDVMYFNNLDYYINFKGQKLILYYEDILKDKKNFIETLYNFLDVDKAAKKEYVINNIEHLFNVSLNGKYISWGGNNSFNKLNFYYNKLNDIVKKKSFDNFLEGKLKSYQFIKDKYPFHDGSEKS
jgi:hypothetical protein